jgi:hypothetical protein
MSGPFLPARAGQPLDLLEQGVAGGGWDELDALFQPHRQDAPLQPKDSVAVFMRALYQTPEGRDVFEWLMDVTLRLPHRATGRTFEETALMTATRQGINGVGEAVLNAIAHGEKLINERNSQNGAGS